MPSPQYASPQTSVGTNVLLATGMINANAALTELRLEDGRVVSLSTAALLQAAAGSSAVQPAEASGFTSSPEASELVLPLVEERLHVGKRVVETGKVRLRKVVQEFDTSLDEVLAVRTFDVERVMLNQPVEAAPAVRQEGETTIYPLVEEQLILTRQLILREELRVTRRDGERHDTRPVTLRRETVEVEREPLG